MTHSVVGLTADFSSVNASDMGRYDDGKVPLSRKHQWFHIYEDTLYD